VVRIEELELSCDLIGNISAGVGGTWFFANLANGTIANNNLRTNGFIYHDFSFEFNAQFNMTISDGSASGGSGMICEAASQPLSRGMCSAGGFEGFRFRLRRDQSALRLSGGRYDYRKYSTG
jgi:hypothetical protein